jgi:leucyl aminopeptidase
VVEEAQKLCAAFPALHCEVLDERQIVAQGLGLLHAVGKGATCHRVCWPSTMNGVPDGPVRCYVGKGITFDTGGLWLKEGAGMYTMKYDMCGAANVLGLMLSVAELGLPVRIMGVLALAENAIGPDAMQPGTVATACNGPRLKSTTPMLKGDWCWQMLSPGPASAIRRRAILLIWRR